MLNSFELKEILPNPQETVTKLDQYIIGQEDAKYTLALMLLNQALMKLAYSGKIFLNTELKKTNVLLIGPTGTGKTGLIKALSEINHIPISINDLTGCTAAGYIGGKVEDVLVNHVNTMQEFVDVEYSRLKDNLSLAVSKNEFLTTLSETGIIYLDEIDKICRRSASDNIDINGDMLQNELLKFLDSGVVNLSSSRNCWKVKMSTLNTKNVLFVCGGAFEGLDKVITTRLSKQGAIGFTSDISHKSLQKNDILKLVTTEDLIKYGFKPEFLGRVPLRAVLNPISPKMMKRIILEPHNSIFSQYEAILSVFNIGLEMSKSGLEAIANLACDLGMGARALQPIFSRVFEEVLFDLWDIKPGTTVIITKKDVQKIRDSV